MDRRALLAGLSAGIASLPQGRAAVFAAGVAMPMLLPDDAQAADTKLSSLTSGTVPTYFYGEEVGVSRKYAGETVFNVKTFGAVGDGIVDDHDAIMNAAAALVASGGFGTIYFPIGKYLVGSALDFSSNNYLGIMLRGESGLSDHTSLPNTGSLIIGNFNGYIIDRNQIVSGVPGLRCIEGIAVKNSDTTVATSGCIRWIGTDTGWIRRCSVQGANGIVCGGDSAPPTATFTGNTTGTSTTLVVTGCSGTISGQNGSITFPVPITGSGVPLGTAISAQQSGTPGGNGTYTTTIACTCSGSSIGTHPNAPTAFCMMISENICNGLGMYNSNPASSFIGTGIQGSPEVHIHNNHCVSWGSGIQIYGGGGSVNYNQLESNTYGVRVGVDIIGQSFGMSNGTVMGNACESNYINMDVFAANNVAFSGNVGQGNNDASHNTIYGHKIKAANGCTFTSEQETGAFSTAALYFSNPEYTSVQFVNCSMVATGLGVSVSKDAACTYAEVQAISCASFSGITLSATLAQQNAIAVAHGLQIGYRTLMSDSTIALTSQVYNATTVGTGTGTNLAPIWWDGTIFRYG